MKFKEVDMHLGFSFDLAQQLPHKKFRSWRRAHGVGRANNGRRQSTANASFVSLCSLFHGCLVHCFARCFTGPLGCVVPGILVWQRMGMSQTVWGRAEFFLFDYPSFQNLINSYMLRSIEGQVIQ